MASTTDSVVTLSGKASGTIVLTRTPNVAN